MNNLLSLLMTQSWQIAALAMIVAVVVKLAATNRPHLAHALWILVLIKCVTPPLWGHSLGFFSQMQTLIGHDSDESTFDAESIVALSVVPAEVTQSQEPIVVENAPVPLTAFPLPQGDIGTVPELVAEQPAFATIQEPPTDQEFVSDDSTAQSAIVAWPSLMLCTLLFGAIATLLVTVVRCVRALRLIHRHHTTEFDDALNERLQQLATQLRIRRVPRIVVSDVLFGPAVLGLLRHTIVLPRCLMSKADSQLEAESENGKAEESQAAFSRLSAFRPPLSFLDPILAHELLHIRRGDLSFGILQVIAQSLWWFHPAVWFSNRWLSREAERRCDEQVIAELGCSPGQYARSLLAVIESKHALQPIPVFPGMKPVEITTQRMERIMSLKTGLNKRTPLWCWLAVIALAIVVLPGAVANTSEEQAVDPSEISTTSPPTHDSSPDQTRVTDTQEPSIAQQPISATENPRLFLEVLESYPVGDLVKPIIPIFSFAHSKKEFAYAAAEVATADSPSRTSVAQPSPALSTDLALPKQMQNAERDFAPLVELIKASVEPESWNDNVNFRITEEPKNLSLLIRQTEQAHERICELLSSLRKSQDQNVQITSLLVKLTTEEQLKGIEDQFTLHSLSRGRKWMLLTPQRSVMLKNWLLEQNPEILWSPKIMTTSGQSAMLIHAAIDRNVSIGSLKMTVTPLLVAGSSVIKLTYTVSIYPDRPPEAAKSPTAIIGTGNVTIYGHEFGTTRHESLVGSGQTLLLLIEQPRPDDDAKGVDRYVLMLTPEHVVEGEERLDGGK